MNFKIVLFLLLIVFLPACMSSESDYKQMVSERDAFAEEYNVALKENGLLKEVLERASFEEERLSKLVPEFIWHQELEYKKLEASPANDIETGFRPVDSNAENATTEDNLIGQPLGVAVGGEGNTGLTKEYIVKSGDRLSDIANTYNTDVNTLLTLNPIVKNRFNYEIQIGETIVLP